MRAKFEFYLSKYGIYENSAFVWSFWSLWPWRSNQRHWLNFLSHLIISGQKNYEKILFFLSGLCRGLQKIFFGLCHFFWDILCLRSPLVCSNTISKFNIIPNGKWFKFPISNHSAVARWTKTEPKWNILTFCGLSGTTNYL